MKYPRTYHLPWSPGATRDDRIQTDLSNLIGKEIIISEKLDGSNVMLSSEGVFARSHSGPPTHPSFNALKPLYYSIKDNLSNYDLFGEWCYAKHSIQYSELPSYLLCFGIRYKEDTHPYDNFWMNWHEFVKVCKSLDLHTTPVLYQGVISSEKELEKLVNSLAGQPSACGGLREGVVVRVAESFPDTVFSTHVCKWVRAGHVQEGDDHWKHKEIIKNILK